MGRGNSAYKDWKARAKHKWMSVWKTVSEERGKMRPEGRTGTAAFRGFKKAFSLHHLWWEPLRRGGVEQGCSDKSQDNR